MKNILEFTGSSDFKGVYKAMIAYDPDIELFRGEFIGLNGGADFYASDIEGLKREGHLSLNVFLAMCEEDGVSPKKNNGTFSLRLDAETHELARVAATAQACSLNQWITKAVRQAVQSDL